jgi:Mannosyltransferase (PIG-V)
VRTEGREVRTVPAERLAWDRQGIRRAVLFCLGVFVVFRVGLALVALAGVALVPTLDPVGVPGWPADEVSFGWHNLVTAWERFDALWFLRIASEGYVDGDGSAAFFPLYPLMIRGLSTVIGDHPLAAALLISHLAAFGSMVMLYLLTASELEDEGAARRTVIYLAVFPTSFFLVAPYSESLFLLLVLACLWAARRRRWAVAGLAGALAAATRNLGVLLVLPLAVEAVHQYWERRQGRGLATSLLWSAAPAAGLGAYLLFWQAFSGDALAPLQQQATWQRTFSFPLATVVAGSQEAFRFPGAYPGGYHLLDWAVVSPALVAASWVAVRARPLYGVYTWASILAPLSFVFAPRPFMSLPRFLLPVFPILWAGAVWAGRRRGVHEAIVAVSAAVLGIFTVLFVTWYFVF